jgi:mono/diheme cytochrome c family protein
MRPHIALLSCIFPMVLVADELETQLVAGAGVYEMNCAQCHVDGKGGPVAPALVGTEIVKGPAKAIVEVILKGQSGKVLVDGKPLAAPMAPLDYLTDEEIASVTAYIRKQFGGVGEVVPVQVVTDARPR